MSDFEKIVLPPTATLRHAIEIIDRGAKKIALVANEERKLLGTVSDGDVRRAILKGVGLDEPIEGIYYRTPTTCEINDSREKLIQLAVTHKLNQIPVIDAAGKIVGLAGVDELLLPQHRTNSVVLMAGGLGTRLRPLTDTMPKPMLQVGNKPIMETIIKSFAEHGYTNIILSVNYKSHVIEEYFGDGAAFGVKIEYVHETKRMGTAGALALVRDKLTEPFFVMNGDLLTNVNFGHMHDYHVSHDALATMAVRQYDFQVPYGVVNIHDGKVVSIEEKPTHTFFVSAGIYMLSPQALKQVPYDEFFDMPTLFEKVIEAKANVVSFPIREYWLDIGRISDYERANSEYDEIFR